MGDRAMMIELGDRVDPRINQTVRAVADALLASPLEGVVDVVPAFTTVTIHYRPERIATRGADDLPHRRVARWIETVLDRGIATDIAAERTVDVPVCYGGEFGPDLDDVAARCELTPSQVIEIHAASPHLVYMLGFAPGFPYLGGLDERLAMPRRATPRTRVPAGTVAIAREQTAIYSIETPGGWNLLGRTPVTLFAPLADPPCLLRPGDRVRFVPISLDRYNTLHAMASEGA